MSKAHPLWSLLQIEADYAIPDDTNEMVAETTPQAVVRGTVTAAAAGQSYLYPDGAVFETAYLTVNVAEANGIEANPGESITVEIVKPSLVTTEDLAAATITDQALVLMIDSEPMFPPDVEVTDLDPSTSTDGVYPCSSTVGILITDGDDTVSLITGDKVLEESAAETVPQLFDEVVAELPPTS